MLLYYSERTGILLEVAPARATINFATRVEAALKPLRSPLMPPIALHTPKTDTTFLRLEAQTVRVDAGQAIEVFVAFDGLEQVSLQMVPREPFGIDLKSLSRPGTVRMKGQADGVATLIARGSTATGAQREAMLHVRCDGAELRLLGWGYIPADD